MNARKITSAIFGVVGFGSGLLASSVKETSDWFVYAKPFLIVFIICMAIALTLGFWNHIRRVTYPATVCIWAWLYKHKILITDFSRSTYLVYRKLGKSYERLYYTVQDAFDYYLSFVAET